MSFADYSGPRRRLQRLWGYGGAGGRVWGVAALVCAIALGAIVFLAPSWGMTSRIPVAVVNLDRGATDVSGVAVDAGRDLVDSLMDGDELAWEEVDRKTALAGMGAGAYALMLTVPEDYSKRVVSLDTDKPQRAVVELQAADGENPLATKAGASVLKQVQSRLRATFGKDYLISVLTDVRGEAGRLQLAADGSTLLEDGLGGLSRASSAISQGLVKTADAATRIGAGMQALSQSARASATGAAALDEGLSALRDQAVVPLGHGVSALAEGMQGVSASLQQGSHAASDVAVRLRTLSDAMAADAETLTSGAPGEGLAAMEGARRAYDVAQKEAADAVPRIQEHAEALGTAHRQAGERAQSIKTGIRNVGDMLSAPAGQTQDPSQVSIAELLARIESVNGDPALSAEERASAIDALVGTARAKVGDASAALAGEQGIVAQADVLEKELSASDGHVQEIAAGGQALIEASDAAGGAMAGFEQAAQPVVAATSGLATNLVSSSAALSALSHSVEGLSGAMGTAASLLSSEGALGGTTSGIAAAAHALDTGVASLSAGSRGLSGGSSTLAQALSAAAAGISGLGAGAGAMADASDQLGQGALQLKDAAASFGQGVDDAARSLDVLASHRDERASVASARVTVDMGAARIEPATAVAPLAVACALWIGSAVASCVLPDIDRRAALAGRAVRAVLNQIAVYAAFAILQTAAGGVALGACGCFEGLGLSQVFVVLATLLLASCACCAFAQALRLLAPRAALGVELVLFALQLMAAGVVVPASMASPGAAVFGALTPMGAVAAAVRSALAGHFAVSSVGLLAGVVAVSLGVVFLFARCARRVRPERLRTAA